MKTFITSTYWRSHKDYWTPIIESIFGELTDSFNPWNEHDGFYTELHSLEKLHELLLRIKEQSEDEIVLSINNGLYHIEIYDGYRE